MRTERRRACCCPTPYFQGRCVSCGRAAVPVQNRLRGWVIAAVIVACVLVGWLLAGDLL